MEDKYYQATGYVALNSAGGVWDEVGPPCETLDECQEVLQEYKDDIDEGAGEPVYFDIPYEKYRIEYRTLKVVG